MSIPNMSCACMGRGWFTLDMMGDAYKACEECKTHEIYHGMPRLLEEPKHHPMCNCGTCQCEIHKYLMGDGRCTCGQAPEPTVVFEVLNELPPDAAVRIVYGPPRDFVAADMAGRMAELLSKYGAALEAQINKSGHPNCSPCIDLRSRATLAREMSVIYFRAAELEKSS